MDTSAGISGKAPSCSQLTDGGLANFAIKDLLHCARQRAGLQSLPYSVMDVLGRARRMSGINSGSPPIQRNAKEATQLSRDRYSSQ